MYHTFKIITSKKISRQAEADADRLPINNCQLTLRNYIPESIMYKRHSNMVSLPRKEHALCLQILCIENTTGRRQLWHF